MAQRGTALALVMRGLRSLPTLQSHLQFAFCLFLLFTHRHEALLKHTGGQGKCYVQLQPRAQGADSTPCLTS